ncbi:hypothetical protein [Streptomyces canus]|uniref:hypothetical protein n=1 Tax=Streptomyces canus TaxID=58343 RepID=UPI002DDBDDCB|nr:hypothetical protein [Streptomyces canus]WSD91394.1 hypothetical protein OG925_47005 [Streptomyces canus]
MTDIDTQFLRSLFDEEGSLHTAGRTALYRLHGPEGLLYVGISTCPLTRIRTHLQQQPRGPPRHRHPDRLPRRRRRSRT